MTRLHMGYDYHEMEVCYENTMDEQLLDYFS